MLSVRQAQTGNRVYNGFSQSPNRGQVSAAGAQGYIKRELRNRNRAGVVRQIGGDGQSDSRSTVAARALNQYSKPLGTSLTSPSQSGPIRYVPNEGGTKTPPPTPNPNLPTTPQPNTPQQPGNGTVGNGGGGGVGPTGPTAPPTVQVTEDGILQLPYNQQFSAAQYAAITDANNELLALKMEGDQQALEYGAAKRNAGLAYESLKHQTLNNNAANGTAFSSMYGTAVARNAGGYANQLGQIESDNTNFLNNQRFQRGTIQSSLNAQLAALAQEYADSLNGSAGDLGYGQADYPDWPDDYGTGGAGGGSNPNGGGGKLGGGKGGNGGKGGKGRGPKNGTRVPQHVGSGGRPTPTHIGGRPGSGGRPTTGGKRRRKNRGK